MKQTIMSELKANPLFKNLSEVTMYALVYENISTETYYPGELIMAMDERSQLNANMFPYYKDRYTDFFLAIDQRKKDARDGTKTKPPTSPTAPMSSPRTPGARKDKDAGQSSFGGYPRLREALLRRAA
jgi:hypothetical protein